MKRIKQNISYRVLDGSGHTVDVIKRTGYNKDLIRWQVERYIKRRYGQSVSIKLLKSIDIDD